ncbi:ABC transporter ATP-binding protein [Veillonella ratti]|uniref:ABC transporter ATP-binding protein n=1 Tax=Veillonella ratti TaxID=103892 RepID=UPI000F8CF0FE|nr:ABC transporter ATP-binding protein [Veillonella ratti]
MEISTQNIQLSVGKKNILRGIDIELYSNEILGIIGPNGSGKSTFLKCVYRTLKPDAGKITLDGKSIDELSYRDTALKMAVVAQHNIYNFDFKVIDIVLMGRAPYKKLLSRDTKDDFELARAALAKVGLLEKAEQSFNTLSGGEQQRTILARALAQDTECLILDEPTNHLDIRYQLEIMELIQKLQRTTLIAVHDLNIAAKFCHRLIALRDGQVVGQGTPKELLTVDFIKELYGVESSVHYFGDNIYPHVVFESTL